MIIKTLLMLVSLSFAMAIPTSALAAENGVPLFGKVGDGVFKHYATLEGKQPDGIHVLFCLTEDGERMQCVAMTQDDDGKMVLLISKPTTVQSAGNDAP